MNSDLKRERFDHLLSAAGETSASLGRKTGLSPSIFYNFIHGRSQTFEPDTIEKIAPFLHIEPENFWKDKYVTIEHSVSKNNNSPSPERGSRLFPLNSDDFIPMYGAVSASSPEVVNFTEEYMIEEVPRHPAVQKVKGAFAMQVSGDSMAPRHFPGERVYINPHQVPHVGQDCVIVSDPDGNAILKRFMGESATEWKFSQLNPAKDLTIDKSKVRRIYAVVR